jgi:outer membrane protein TolC
MNTSVRSAVHASISVVVLLSLFSLGSVAISEAGQQQPARVLALEEALELAQSRSEQMVIARAGVDRAEGELGRVRSELFPQLSGSASYDRALASEFSDIFDSPSTTPCAPFVANPSGSVDQRLAELERAVDCGATGAPEGSFGDLEELPFGRENTYRFNLSFSQNLFSGGRIGAQTAIANAGRQTAQINLGSTRAQLLLDVVRAYYDAVLSEQLLVIAEATYKQADATYEQTRLMFQAGSQPEFELLRAQVSRDNQRPLIIRSRADRDIAMLRLKQLVDIPRSEAITLSAALEGDTLPPPASFAAGVILASETEIPEIDRAPVREAVTAVQQSEAAVDVARSQRFPTLSLTSSFGNVAYPGGAFPAFGDFRQNWTVGALVQVPILTGGRLRAEEAMARADTRIAEARLQLARELALLDTQSAYEELRAAVASWQASAGTVQQAQRAYEIAELRYREGVSTQLELSDSRLLLVQAQATRATAGRDLQVARARVALLPDLPLSSTGATTLPAATTTPATQTPQQGTTRTVPVIRATGAQAVQGGGGGM